MTDTAHEMAARNERMLNAIAARLFGGSYAAQPAKEKVTCLETMIGELINGVSLYG